MVHRNLNNRTEPTATQSHTSLDASLAPPGMLQGNTDTYTVDSTQLLQGRKAITISHHGIAYRLQQTKLGKLILTK